MFTLDDVSKIGELLFNVGSAAALLTAAYWFYRRERYAELFRIAAKAEPVVKTPTTVDLQFTISIENIGETRSKMGSATLVLHPVTQAITAATPVNMIADNCGEGTFVSQDQGYFIMPGTICEERFVLPACQRGQCLAVSWYVFCIETGPITSAAKLTELKQQHPDDFYFDTELIYID